MVKKNEGGGEDRKPKRYEEPRSQRSRRVIQGANRSRQGRGEAEKPNNKGKGGYNQAGKDVPKTNWRHKGRGDK